MWNERFKFVNVNSAYATELVVKVGSRCLALCLVYCFQFR